MGQATSERVKVNYKKIERELEIERSNYINKIPDQVFSFSREFPEFNLCFEQGEGLAKLDLCILANKPTKDFRVLRKECQDYAGIARFEDAYLIGVFDGHGPKGERIAKMCVNIMQKVVGSGSSLPSNPKSFLSGLMGRFQNIAASNRVFQARHSGSTATLALINREKIRISWVGDSKAILLTTCHKKFLEMKAFELTRDHNFGSQEEIRRVETKGGVVVKDSEAPSSPSRVYSLRNPSGPGLAMSRSIGDLEAHKVGCTSEADFVEIDLNKINEKYFPKPENDGSKIEHAILVVASDGIWNAMAIERVAELLSLTLYNYVKNIDDHTKPLENLSVELCLYAQKQWLRMLGKTPASTDDITAATMLLF